MAASNDQPFTIGTFLNRVRALPGPANRIIRRVLTTGLTVERREFEQWADPNDTTDNSIVDMYLGMICHYVNRQAGGILGPPGIFLAPPDVYYEPSKFLPWHA